MNISTLSLRSLLALSVIAILSGKMMAQTCSCAGAPLVSSQSFVSVDRGNFVFGLTYEYHDISDLYNGTQELENITQKRTSNTALFEVHYGISPRFTFTSTFTFIEKNRTTGLQNPGNTESLSTSGLGDGLAMLKYHVLNQDLWNPYQISIGLGSKIPFARTDLKVNGLALNADMQPGTGAWDGVGWLYTSRVLRRYNMNIYTNSSYRYTGSNERFNASDKYKFGNEWVSLVGVAGSLIDRFSYNVLLKYRFTTPDELNGNPMPSTGGEWIYLKPGLGIQLTDRLNLQLNGEVPLYQDLRGTQPTTNFILSGSLFFSLDKIETGFTIGAPNGR